MSEERLNKLEGYMEQLIRMVADNNKIVSGLQQEMKEERKLNQQRYDEFREEKHLNQQRYEVNEQRYEEFKEERQLNQERHEVLLTELRKQNVDTEYLRNQVSKHDLEIHRIQMMK
ncbi:vacuolar-type H+-ATPase subunit I/STV1 [Geomicrobium halophilum]|uniref:Vacuolar-type H+-ATPase subunit I/STV1 n=1 Tax=Geomicrobium halophilum TaxID=549000 RepID=A0A841PND6_9BACL|nr:hypothetical protein [Geomicrobium halophilum]MBB6448716.1 vacuolar-type H+-ATPase subunit I/STV1 [Geomicrobium halophilum]